jgi:hypothetical protein
MARGELGASRVAAALCALLFPAVAGAQLGVGFEEARDWHLAVSIGRASPEIRGDLLLGEDFGATPIDVDDALDLDADRWLSGRGELRLDRHHVRFEYVPARSEGDAILTEPVLAFGIPFFPGNRVESELGARQYRLAYRFDFPIGERLTLAPVLELDLLDAWIDLDNVSVPGARLAEDVLAPLPLAGLRVELRPLPRVEVFAEARGLRVGSIGPLSDVRAWSGEAGASLLLTRNVALRGRYALDDYRVAFSDIDIDLRQHGPSLDIELRF